MPRTRRPLLVRIYLRERKMWQRLMRVLDGVHAGVWLGVLSPRQFEAADEAHYETGGTYTGEEHNLRGLMPWEEEAIGEFFAGRTRLAVLGAGGGREVLALERRGYAVDGFECNPALVEFAGGFLPRHGGTGTVRLLPRDAVPADGGYDGVIMGWSAYTLIPGRERRIALLRRLRALMPEGAPLLLSFFTRPDDVPRLRITWRVARAIRRVLRREPPELGDDVYPTWVHRFTQAEVEAEMRAAGFLPAKFVPERGAHEPGWAVGHVVPSDG